MRVARWSIGIVALVTYAACSDGTAPSKPATIEVVAGATQTGTAGQRVPVAPSFVVRNKEGNPLAGIEVSVRVTAGDGIVSDVPAKTSAGATSVGTWSLGPRVGANQLTITVPGLAPVTITATAQPGPPAKVTALTSLAVTGRVAEVVAPTPSVRLTDAFDNPLPRAIMNLSATGGGIGSTTVTTDSLGIATIPGWTLGTIVGQSVLTVAAGATTISFIADVQPGDPVDIVTVTGAGQDGRAGAPVDAPIMLRAVDRFANAITNQPMTFAVTSGNGTLATTTALPGPDGIVTVPAWTLGRTALPQIVHAAVGPASADVTVTVKTDYHIDVRFFGPPMTPDLQAPFTNAAARLSAIVVGDVPDMPAQPVDLYAFCGVPGLPVYSEPLDDIVIYASVQDIDGPGKVLAEAGPCAFRNAAHGGFAAFGVMLFDAADVATLQTQGTLQDVITHEMLHVLGIGTAWTRHGLLTGAGTIASTYVGTQGRQGCFDTGGSDVCGTGVPVENNGVIGTADSHWRETTFQSELMTGYVNTGGMPLSAITVGALADLGYVVNPLAADPYRVPLPAARSTVPAPTVDWEKALPIRGGVLP